MPELYMGSGFILDFIPIKVSTHSPPRPIYVSGCSRTVRDNMVNKIPRRGYLGSSYFHFWESELYHYHAFSSHECVESHANVLSPYCMHLLLRHGH